LEIKLEHTFQRHLRLVESVSDLVYELDQEGRFIYVSSSVTQLLGYAPEELAGRHFSILVPPAQDHLARYRMNERRAGARSVHELELHISGKASAQGKERTALMQLTAKGLYDRRQRYLGAVGLLRDLSAERHQTSRVQELEARLQEADRQLAASRDAALISRNLQQPLSALAQDSQQLLATLQSMHIGQRLKQLADYATHATELGHEVWKSIQFQGRHISAVSLNNELHHVIAELSRERFLHPKTIEQRLGRSLPGIVGIPREIREAFRILILYALHSLTGAPGGTRLLLETFTLKTAGAASPSPPSPPFSHHVVIVIRS
jgi:PAS domain S-box-containing protein